MSLVLRDVSRRFGDFTAVDRVSLEVPDGSLLALLGPSGSGKTTLLRIIAGLEVPDGGTVHFRGEDLTGRRPQDRHVGFVFQHYALFRHLSVFENVAFALRVRGWKQAAVAARVGELLHLVRLEGLERRYPSQLSGGQRQRVALARSLAASPRLLLLDEPFGALDARVREELRQWLRRLHDEMGVTTVLVTHDQEEAFSVADRVVLMNHGRVEQVGTPMEVFEHPASAFVMDFLGNVNVFHGRVVRGRARLGGLEVDWPDYPHAEERAATGYVRPHELEVFAEPGREGALSARVVHIHAAGAVLRAQLRAVEGGAPLTVEISPERQAELGLRPGDLVGVAPRRVRVFMPDDYAI